MNSLSYQQQTIQQCINIGEQLFIDAEIYFGHGTDNAADEALWLVFYQLGLSWDAEDFILNEVVSENDFDALISLYERRINERIPAAYLTGEAWFAGIPFAVNKSVLVPRSPLAELINNHFEPWLEKAHSSILDLCTGSGCIGIASALYIQDSRVLLSDISDAAIDVAKVNINRHELTGRVDAVVSDLFDNIPKQAFDLIVSNPPYVDAKDLAEMPPEYHAEPVLGLASGADGLDFTRRLLREAPDYLSDDGVLIVEVGNSWVNLEAAFPEVPFLWLEFEFGGHGVFVISKAELLKFKALFV